MFELQEKLAYKELLAVGCISTGTYMGNNYLSCVITAQNALRTIRIQNIGKSLCSIPFVPNTNWLWLVWKKVAGTLP